MNCERGPSIIERINAKKGGGDMLTAIIAGLIIKSHVPAGYLLISIVADVVIICAFTGTSIVKIN